MTKKDLANVTADLSALASMMPTQRPAAAPPIAVEPAALKVVPPAAPIAKDDTLTQFSFGLRKELRKQLSRLADDADMTMRAFVLNALKAKGLAVRDDDLLDLRKERH
jgi:hypothetical protein